MAGIFEQGDGSTPSSQVEDDSLPPLLRIQKYAQSENFNDRGCRPPDESWGSRGNQKLGVRGDRNEVSRMVWSLLTELFKTAPPDTMTAFLPQIMNTVVKLVDESDLARKEYLKQIPNVAVIAKECSARIPALENISSQYLLPVIVRNLRADNDDVWRCVQTALFSMIKLELVSLRDIEVKVCPTVLALSRDREGPHKGIESTIITAALTLMSKLATFLGPEVTERVLLDRFAELCHDKNVTIRRVCAVQFHNFCSVVGKNAYEKVLLPSFIDLCNDPEWTVRKVCADMAISVSYGCPPEIRRTSLVPIFVNLLKDSSRWVRMSAFQTLGPFISTFADPANSISLYGNLGEQIYVNTDGTDFRIKTTFRHRQFEMLHDYVVKNMFNFNPLEDPCLDDYDVREAGDITIDIPMSEDDESTESSTSVEVTDIDKKLEDVIIQKSYNVVSKALYGEVIADDVFTDDDETLVNQSSSLAEFSTGTIKENEDIKEIVETVKNAVLSFRSDCNKSEEGCFENNKEFNNEDFIGTEILLDDVGVEDVDLRTIEKRDVVKKDEQTIIKKDDGDLNQFNSYNYWYISPDIPVDLSIVEEGKVEQENSDASTNYSTAQTDHLSNLFSSLGLDDSLTKNSSSDHTFTMGLEGDTFKESVSSIESSEQLDISRKKCVPEILVLHFMSMTDPSLQRNTDNEMAFHCAYSLPAVALAIGSENWHILQDTIEDLASDVQYKVRRTVASSLHVLGLILGPEITTNNLVPIFEGFIKDLDEVRIGVLEHLAEFLKLLSPITRALYLPRLTEFLQADNELNWRFRQELAEQLRLVLPLFRPADAAKHIVYIATTLLSDKVAAVRDSALELVSELLKHISVEKDLTHRILIMLAERFAHSKKWKRRQTFTLLCCHILENESVHLEVFATDIMPHLLDLSWDPVPNVRLVVARTIAKHMIQHSFFSDPTNQYNEGLETVMRRLQADKDRDVRQSAVIQSSDDFLTTTPQNH
ncbi:serine/threonine-protein phosphatase 4 regulatory subunit 1-like isoform X3 [Onthophagus taurus]|uniref:serine/threonine-protein phosphatase 4 regulatory subunit 1-like isoform X3 n=1 Tax=Onthophagus taurus TaxID=166361 RepID=UPI0039BEA18E